MDQISDRSHLTHLTSLPDGRRLAFGQYGAPEGPPLLLLPSAPGSRLFDPDPGATATAGVRLLVVDRPGYGASTPVAPGEIPNWGAVADDLAAALDELGVPELAVVGWSAGGVGALALAARHPRLVHAVAVVGTPAPDDELPWIDREFRPLLESLRDDPTSATATLTRMLGAVVADPSAALSIIAAGTADQRLLTERAALRTALEVMLVEAFRQGAIGMASDIVAANAASLGFALDEVRQSVSLYYGPEDVIVPSPHGQYYAGRLRNARLTLLPGEGHLAIVSAWPDILSLAAP